MKRRTPCGPLALTFLLSIAAHAQWLNFRDPGAPRLPDGRVDLRAPAPKDSSGKPDLSGVWMHETTTAAEMRRLYGNVIDEAIQVDAPGMEIGTQHRYSRNILLDFKPEDSPVRPEALERMRRSAARPLGDACTPGFVFGFPLAGLLSEPIKIVQAPHLTMVLYEAGNFHRQIYSDGRGLPEEVNLPAYNGYSAGHWEPDGTFVVETSGFNDKTPLDGMGHPHSESLRVIERFRRVDFGDLEYEITFDDPKMYTKPFSVKIPHHLLPDADVFENFCENEKDRVHLGR